MSRFQIHKRQSKDFYFCLLIKFHLLQNKIFILFQTLSLLFCYKEMQNSYHLKIKCLLNFLECNHEYASISLMVYFLLLFQVMVILQLFLVSLVTLFLVEVEFLQEELILIFCLYFLICFLMELILV